MNRLAVLMLLFGVSGASLADEPAFCKSMCTSERNTCRANGQAREEKEALLPVDAPEKNPFARAAQVQARPVDGGALEQSGYEHRRMTRNSACEDSYQRCTRSCAVPAGKPTAG